MTIRLYSSFPKGAAAVGLLLLRILSGGGLAEQSRRVLWSLFAAPESKGGALGEIVAAFVLVASILIIAGLWTSIAAAIGTAAALMAAGLGLVHSESLIFAALSTVIGLIGPGALSLDAHLFGWRQIRFPHSKGTGPGRG
jgi:hypothetical protein